MSLIIVEPSACLLTPPEHLKSYTKLVEKAGRTCYKSEDRITDTSAARFVGSLIARGHESVIEHCTVMFKMVMSRTASHQLVRHRLCGFSQESQRYCDYSGSGFQIIVPPSIKQDQKKLESYLTFCQIAYNEYRSLRDLGVPPEDARFVLPGAFKTEIVVSSNLRNWRHMIRERALNVHAQWEIKELMKSALLSMYAYLPVFFQDLMHEFPDLVDVDLKIDGENIA